MKWAGLVALVLSLVTAANAQAQTRWLPPNPYCNLHAPYQFYHCTYLHKPGYQIWGLTDPIYPCLQPVSGIGPPPFGLYLYNGHFRSPRDFFMR
ncbi:MAG: hypothetical protein C4297_06680 [Gemmataceae bacterium]